MCLYLARADRVVIGADLTRASLRLGAAAARRFGLDRVQFVETDLRQPGLKAGVVRRRLLVGRPAPHAGPARVVRPSGAARATGRDDRARASTTRSRASRCGCGVWSRGCRVSALIPFDPVLRDRQHEPERREAWLRDQYQHPEEHRHTLAEVQGWFAENGVEYLRTYPSAVLVHEPGELFARAEDNWRLEGWLAQLGWIRALGHEGGLFFTVGRRV